MNDQKCHNSDLESPRYDKVTPGSPRGHFYSLNWSTWRYSIGWGPSIYARTRGWLAITLGISASFWGTWFDSLNFFAPNSPKPRYFCFSTGNTNVSKPSNHRFGNGWRSLEIFENLWRNISMVSGIEVVHLHSIKIAGNLLESGYFCFSTGISDRTKPSNYRFGTG